MKLLLSIGLLLLYFASIGQKKQFNTRVDSAGKVIIEGGTTTILKADTVFIGQVIINQNVPDAVYFLGSTTTIDTNGIYTMTYKFAPKYNPGTFNINVTMAFNKPFIPYYNFMPPPPKNAIQIGRENHVFDVSGDNGEPQTSNAWSDDYKTIRVRGLVAADNIFITVKSKEKLYAKIYGVAGEIKSPH